MSRDRGATYRDVERLRSEQRERDAKTDEERAALERAERHRRERRIEGSMLLAIPRGDSKRLRLSHRTHEGKPYLELRMDERDAAGVWEPTPHGCSVRMHEIRALVAAFEAAEAGQRRGAA